MRRPAAKNFARAFTLVEILVVVVIIVLLIAIMVPTFSYARRQARISATESLLGNINTGVDAYRADFTGRLPQFGSPGANSGPKVGYYEMNFLAGALSGYKPATSGSVWGHDGHDGPGFKISAESRVYGPYYSGGKNLKIYANAADFPNPAAAAAGTPSGEREMSPLNAAFVDAWGLPIFYLVGNASMQRAQAVDVNGLIEVHAGGYGNAIFLKGNPDTANSVTYTVNGQSIQSRLVPYTPAGTWNPDTTPWGLCLALTSKDYEASTSPNPKPGIAFRKLIGMSNPSSSQVQRNDRLRGRNSYLVYSAGPDNQFYTGDEVIAEGR